MRILLLILLISFQANATTGNFYILPFGAYGYVSSMVTPKRLESFVIYCPNGSSFYTNKDSADKLFYDILDSYYVSNPHLPDTILNIDSAGKPIFK